MVKRFFVALALCVIGRTAEAQILRGSVSDSASQRPIAGAVLILLDGTGNVLGRNLTNERGDYSIARTAAIQRVRVQRIGFRPRELPLPEWSPQDVRLDIHMTAIPAFLEPVRVTAAACAGKKNQESALALLEQARAGLLASVVARAAKPASLTLYMYERAINASTERADYQRVWKDSTYRSAVSFSAVRSADQFVKLGFMADDGKSQTFFAPDADVLLHDSFTVGYCFRIMPPNRNRPMQVGLGFEPENRKQDRVDIDGALWIDTAARALRDIEFKYTGLSNVLERLGPGGSITFREMQNGTVLIDRWKVRLVGAVPDTIDRNPSSLRVGVRPYISESGGELAHVRWRDGTSWDGSLGALDLYVMTRKNQPWPGVTLQLAGSPYRSTTGTDAHLLLRDLVPGPYAVSVVDSALAPIGWQVPTDLWFMSQRDSLAMTLKVPTTEEYILDRCFALRRAPFNPRDTVVALARVMTSDGQPVNDARWRVEAGLDPRQVDSWATVKEGQRTAGDGLIPLCSAALKQGWTVEFTVEHERLGRAVARRVLDKRVNVFVIFLGG